jgi:cobalt-zinc-cadmium efflux system protein
VLVQENHFHSAAHATAGRLRLVLWLTAAYLVVELVAAALTGSLALLADAGHMLTDVVGVSMALLAIRFANRPATAAKSYGYYRLEMLAALANGLLLVGVAAYILVEAVMRFSDPPDIPGVPVLAVATVGLLVNLVSAGLLFEGQKTSLNMRGAFLEVVSDFLGSVAVMIAALVIITTGFQEIDALASIFIGLFILPRTLRLMAEAVHVLLEGVPRDVDMSHVREHFTSTPNVVGVHDLHVWSMTSGMPIMSAHVVITQDAAAARVLDELGRCLREHFDIEHSTIQIERADRSHLEHAGH